MNVKEIGDLAQKNGQKSIDALRDLPSDLSLDRFIAASTRLGPLDHYKFFPPDAHSLLDEVRGQYGDSGLKIYLRAALLRAVADLIGSQKMQDFPPAVLRNHLPHLARIAADDDLQADWLDVSSDLFQKDFGLATLRLYGAAAQLVDYRCGIPRSIVSREGIAQAPGKTMTLMRLGGFRPYFQIHTHLSYLDEFNQEGWDECYRCCAELYKLHPEVLGMFGSSWFYDSALASISPRLSYLRERPVNGGAHLMFVERGGDAIDNSVATSPTRRKLYDAGEYMPTSYMLIWGKDDQVAWAQGHPAN